MNCPLCGTPFSFSGGVPEQLFLEWGLTEAERAPVRRRESVCSCARLNPRGAALVRAIRAAALVLPAGRRVLVNTIVRSRAADLFPGMGVEQFHHPDLDLCALPFGDGELALLAHSDTLEHVRDVGRALAEAERVLAPGGMLAFTVPAVPGRPTRSRESLPPSYHGPDLVWWEFGTEELLELVRGAGFEAVADAAVGLITARKL